VRWPALPANAAAGGSAYLTLELFESGLPQTQAAAEIVAASD
jgi:hypothetical protein